MDGLIEIGHTGRYISLDGIKNDLIGTTKTLEKYCKSIGFDESEVEELSSYLSGEVEVCSRCKCWRHTYEITDEGCTECEEDDSWLDLNKNKHF